MNTIKKILLTTLLVGVVGCSEMDLTKVVEQTPATSAVIEIIEVEVLREVVELPELEPEVVHEDIPLLGDPPIRQPDKLCYLQREKYQNLDQEPNGNPDNKS